MKIVSAFLFGKFHVNINQRSELNLGNGRTSELFSYLLLHPDRPHSRNTLAHLLWSDTENQQARRYLSKALWQLRSALGDQSQLIGEELLTVDPGWIQLNTGPFLWLDVAAFEQAYRECHADLAHVRVSQLQTGIEMYQGELLADCYQTWCMYPRERFKLMLLAMLEKLMDYYESKGLYREGLRVGMRLLEEDDARERSHRRLMRLFFQLGDRTAALRQYEQCAAILREELGVKPGNRTAALLQQICQGQAPSVGKTIAASPAPPRDAQAQDPRGDTDLQQVHDFLVDMQHRIAREISAIEAILDQ